MEKKEEGQHRLELKVFKYLQTEGGMVHPTHHTQTPNNPTLPARGHETESYVSIKPSLTVPLVPLLTFYTGAVEH